jgi:hypothetical protein
MFKLNLDVGQGPDVDLKDTLWLYHMAYLMRCGHSRDEAMDLADWKEGLKILLKSLRINVVINVRSVFWEKEDAK